MPAIPLDRNAWTEPGTFEVAPGVYRIPLPLPNDGLRAVNVYALVHGAGLLLIDSGWAIPGARAVLDQALAALGATAADVRRFLVTHVHRDHYTQAIYLRREFGAPVSLGIGERPSRWPSRWTPVRRPAAEPARLPAPARRRRHRRPGGQRLQGPRDPDQTGWEAPDEWLRDGQVIAHGGRSLDVVATPGHTRGHVVFHDPAAGCCSRATTCCRTITPSIGFEPMLADDPLGAFLGSLP